MHACIHANTYAGKYNNELKDDLERLQYRLQKAEVPRPGEGNPALGPM